MSLKQDMSPASRCIQRLSLPLKTACCVSRGSVYSEVWKIRDMGHAAFSTELKFAVVRFVSYPGYCTDIQEN